MKQILMAALMALSLSLMGCGGEPNAAATPAAKPVGSIQTACTEELQRCADGSAVGRNPANACAFDACPSGKLAAPASAPKPEGRMCTMDVKMCPDGSSVGRDSANNCAFRPCKG